MDQKWQDWTLRIGLEPTVLVPEKSTLHQNLQNSIANSIVWSTVGPEVSIKEKKWWQQFFMGQNFFSSFEYQVWVIFSCYQIYFFLSNHRWILISVGVGCSGHHMCFFCQITHSSVWKRERKKILRFKIHFWLVISHFGFWLFSVVRKYIFFFFFGSKIPPRTVWREPI